LNPATHAKQTAFSMLELIITLTLIGILVSVASASWQAHLTKARRITAISLLTQLANRQETFHLQNRRYANQSELASAPPGGLGLTATGKHYQLSVTTSGQSYLATATRRDPGLQADDECYLFSISSAGERRAQNSAGENITTRCWPD
jgi:type IV pilus assembly protein PilE